MLRNLVCPAYLVCLACPITNTHRVPVLGFTKTTIHPLERIHIDVLGPTAPPSLAWNRYALGILDAFTSKSGVTFLEQRIEVSSSVRQYMALAEMVNGHRLQNILLDGEGEHRD